MKNTFTIYLFVLLLYGVFGVKTDEIETVSVMEGDSVTLHTDVTDIQRNYLTLWRFGDEGFTIARINRDKIIYSDISSFRDRLQLDNQTGSLTITNGRAKHSGLYKVEISSSTGTLLKRFRVTVYDSPRVIDAETGELNSVSVMEGDSAHLKMEDTKIQRYDLIVWRFGGEGILIVKGDIEDNKTFYNHNEKFRDRLQLDNQIGSLTITNTRTTDSGLYKVKISSSKRTQYKRFIVTVSASGLSSGAVAAIIVVLLVLAAAAGVFVFYYRRRTSEIKKQNDVFIDKTVSMKPGDSVTLHTGVKEIQKDDKITWMFEGTSIAKISENQTVDEIIDERFKGRLQLNHQTGSLTIRKTRTEHTGLYKVKMALKDLTSSQIFSVSASDKLSVNEGDPFTLNTGVTEVQRDKDMMWKCNDTIIAEISESRQASDWVVEKYRDRIQLDPLTGSITIRNSRTRDSGIYTLQTEKSEKERKFIVSVRGRAPVKKLPELKKDSTDNTQEKSELMAEVTPSIVFEQTGSTKNAQEDSEMIEVTQNIEVEPTDEIKSVSVKEGDPFTLYTDLTDISHDMILWKFGEARIAGLIMNKHTADADKRFRDRLQLDHQTGSLTITNTRNRDSGLYTLKLNSGMPGNSERKFKVIVSAPSTENKENDLEAVHTTDRRDESDPLLSEQADFVGDQEGSSV